MILSCGCAPIEYSVIIVQASKAIAEAETAGAACTQEQLDRLSPVTRNKAPDPGTELVSSEDEVTENVELGAPTCDAPYEYYSAIEYRQKAREEVSYSDYQVAVEPNPQMTYQDALTVAMKKEKAAFKLYSDLAATAPDEKTKTLFLALAQEEARHKLRFEIEYDDMLRDY